MNDIVRPAVHDDLAEVSALEAMARVAMASQRGGAAHLAETPPEADWAAVVDAGLVWVAEIDGVVLGYLQLVLRGTAAVVRQVFVHPEARELGFGDRMLGCAVDHATALGCTVLEGTALPGDRDTKNLYERAGITARKIVVSKAL